MTKVSEIYIKWSPNLSLKFGVGLQLHNYCDNSAIWSEDSDKGSSYLAANYWTSCPLVSHPI